MVSPAALSTRVTIASTTFVPLFSAMTVIARVLSDGISESDLITVNTTSVE
jgi:hypothetical protein